MKSIKINKMNNEKQEQIKSYILRNELNKNNRKRSIVYTRAILCNILLSEGLTLTDIGLFFGRSHSWVHHTLNLYNDSKDYKDFRDLNNKILSEIFSETLEEMVLKCRDFSDMIQLQQKIKYQR
jgi:hypothetical protein